MFESLSQRTVIIGNSGAGKSALAESLADSIHVPVIDLDLLNWEGNGWAKGSPARSLAAHRADC
jgi:adenylate kinase family enzyme